MKSLLLAFFLAQGGDITTTAVNLHRGCIEVNPIYGNSVKQMIAVKVPMTVTIGAVAWGAEKQGKRKHAKVILWTGIAAGIGAAAWNLYQSPKC